MRNDSGDWGVAPLWLILKLYRSLRLSGLGAEFKVAEVVGKIQPAFQAKLVSSIGIVTKRMQQKRRDSFLNNTITFHLPMVFMSRLLMEHFIWCKYFSEERWYC